MRDCVRHGRGGGAPEAPPEEPVLFAMGLGRLLLSGLFGFSLIFLAAISGALQQLDQIGLDQLERLVHAAARRRRPPISSPCGSRSASPALVLVLGMIAGVARTVARDFGFRLTPGQAGLSRRRGLFTLSEVVIPIRRTQVALIESGPVARLLGWYKLSFQTLGADRKEGGVQVAAPFARMDEILPILAVAGFPAPPPRAAFHGVPRRALVRKAAPTLALAALATLAAFLFDLRAGFLAAALLALAVLGVLRWRKHAHALGERALFVASGLLRRELWIVPYEKTQTIRVSRGPVQRALRLADLLLDTAGSGAAALARNARPRRKRGRGDGRPALRLVSGRAGADTERGMKARGNGFTLVELMVVIVIIGLAAAAVVLTLPERGGSLPPRPSGSRRGPRRRATTPSSIRAPPRVAVGPGRL